ncbi:translation termination factor eRF1 [Balamuthia mandrillaris]
MEVDQVTLWRQKQVVERLEQSRGDGTSLITLMIPANHQLAAVSKLLSQEMSASSSIKSTTNRKSVQSALKSIQHRVKQLRNPGPNGLAIFCGTIYSSASEGESGSVGGAVGSKQKKELIVVEPVKPLLRFDYKCDSQFHTEALREQLEEGQESYGFIVVDGQGALFAKLRGGSRVEVVGKYTTSLPKKHKAGGQSAPRFQRAGPPPLFGSQGPGQVERWWRADHRWLSGSQDRAVARQVLGRQAEAEGPEGGRCERKGLSQAIVESAEVLEAAQLLKQQKLLQRFFEEVAREEGSLFCCGLAQSLAAMQQGAVEVLLCWDQLPTRRYTLRRGRCSTTAAEGENEEDLIVHYQRPSGQVVHQEPTVAQLLAIASPPKTSRLKSASSSSAASYPLEDDGRGSNESSAGWKIVKSERLMDWLCEHAREQGARLAFIGEHTDLGAQFVRGFGGIGGVLRFQMPYYEEDEEDGGDDYEGDEQKQACDDEDYDPDFDDDEQEWDGSFDF